MEAMISCNPFMATKKYRVRSRPDPSPSTPDEHESMMMISGDEDDVEGTFAFTSSTSMPAGASEAEQPGKPKLSRMQRVQD
jgi:hypothetical protein